MEPDKRKINEKKFSNFEDTHYGRKYWFEIIGKHGWKARYVKEVNQEDDTIKFYQEIYNERNELVEIHEKYPIDKGHIKLK